MAIDAVRSRIDGKRLMAFLALLHPASVPIRVVLAEPLGIPGGVAGAAAPDRGVAPARVPGAGEGLVALISRMSHVGEDHVRPAARNLQRDQVVRRPDFRGFPDDGSRLLAS